MTFASGLLIFLRTHTSGNATWVDVGLLAVAVAAAIFAWFQVREARRLREEQAQPYVVAYLRIAKKNIVELVIANLGHTAATDVRIEFDAPFRRAGFQDGEEHSLVTVPDPIPTLVPGQEWCTIIDSGFEHVRENLPMTVTGTLTYFWTRSKRRRNRYAPRIVLDFNQFAPRVYIETKDMNDAVKSLDKIREAIYRASGASRPGTVPAQENRTVAEWANLYLKAKGEAQD